MSDQRIGTCTVCLTAVTLPYPCCEPHLAPDPRTYRGPVGTWQDGTPDLLALPSDRRVRGRAWRDLPPGPARAPGISLRGRPPGPPPWEFRWVRWRNFSVPADPDGVPAAETVAF